MLQQHLHYANGIDVFLVPHAWLNLYCDKWLIFTQTASSIWLNESLTTTDEQQKANMQCH